VEANFALPCWRRSCEHYVHPPEVTPCWPSLYQTPRVNHGRRAKAVAAHCHPFKLSKWVPIRHPWLLGPLLKTLRTLLQRFPRIARLRRPIAINEHTVGRPETPSLGAWTKITSLTASQTTIWRENSVARKKWRLGRIVLAVG
jgi:hypothetical protein